MTARLLLLASPLAPLPLSGRAVARGIDADSVIARYCRAVGGLDAIRADTTLRMSGRYQEGTFTAATTILWRRPSWRHTAVRRVSVIGPDHFAYVELYDGVAEWEFSEAFARPVRRDTGAALRAGVRGAEFDESFVDYRSKGHSVQTCAPLHVALGDAACVRVLLHDGWKKEYYFSRQTGLLVAMRKAMPLHARGPDVESLSYYGDYRRVGRVLRPFRIEERNVATGRLMNTLQWESIESNIAIGAPAFLPPPAD